MKKIIWAIAVLVVIALIALAVYRKPQVTAGTLKIGVLTPLSGEAAEHGTNSLNGVKLAVGEINKSGGINGSQIQLFPEDSKCDPTTAVSAFNKVTEVDGAQIILGTVCSGDVQAIMPLANQRGVIVLSNGASSPALTNAGEYFSRDYPSDAYEAQVAADVIFNQFHKSRITILFVNNDYGVALKSSFENTFTKLGGKVVNAEGYMQKATDFRTQLAKIQASNPDMVYLISYPVDGGLAIKQARALGLKVPIFGTSGIKGGDFLKYSGSAAEGVVIATPAAVSNSRRNEFIKNYQATFGVQPGITSDTGYDSVYILAQAFAGTKSITEVASNLHKVVDFEGASGTITIGNDGNRTGGNYDLLIVRNGEFVNYAQ